VIVGLVLVVVGISLVLGRVRRRRSERSMSADVLTEVIGTTGLYRGKRWEVGERWWL
jgi:hypothetical protein